MTNTNTTPALDTVTPELAKAKLQLALTSAEMSIQAIQTRADALVYNEDNLAVINDFITDLKKVNKTIDKAHETGKAPAWAICNAWDAAKNDLKGLTAPILAKVSREHTKLCQAAEARKAKNDAETKRKKDIEEKINSTILAFSQEITACKTSVELVSIQNRINAEQGKKTVYLEFLPSLVEKCAELNQPLKDQKEAIKVLERLEAELQFAFETCNDELLFEVENKKEEVTNKINENKVRTQEAAINSSIRSGGGGGYIQTFATVKPKRVTVEWEIKNMALFAKKHPEMVEILAKSKVVDEYVKGRKAEITDASPEIIFDGLRIFQQKKFS